jgi:hypothetical protein
MTRNTPQIRRPRRAWPQPARAAAIVIVASSLTLPAAALASSQPNIQKALAYSRCMRSHGVLRFPDPSSSGAIPKATLQQLGVSLAEWQSAQTACRYLLPNGGNGPSQAQVQQWMAGMWHFARCMRSHGVSNWPDPVIDAGGDPEFYLNGKIDQNSPLVSSKIHQCLHFLPSYAISPGNPVACPGANPGPDATGGCGGSRRATGQ